MEKTKTTDGNKEPYFDNHGYLGIPCRQPSLTHKWILKSSRFPPEFKRKSYRLFKNKKNDKGARKSETKDTKGKRNNVELEVIRKEQLEVISIEP